MKRKPTMGLTLAVTALVVSLASSAAASPASAKAAPEHLSTGTHTVTGYLPDGSAYLFEVPPPPMTIRAPLRLPAHISSSAFGPKDPIWWLTAVIMLAPRAWPLAAPNRGGYIQCDTESPRSPGRV